MKFKGIIFILQLAGALMLCLPYAVANDNVTEQLKSEYLNKVLTLRHFYMGEHLSFQPDGSLIGSAEVGPWTAFGQILVKDIEMHGHVLHLQGRRVCLVFDSKGKPYRDVLELIDESARDKKEREALEKHYLENSVEIEIALYSDLPDLSEITPSMDAVFIRPDERLTDIMPDYWRDYFSRLEGVPNTSPKTTETVYKVREGEVSAPQIIYQPEPEFSEEARMSKFQGKVTLSVVVDASGSTTGIQIASPLGLGLDEKAVQAIRGWKFMPAMKDARPVPVTIMVEVEFHLY